jgi:hypothetical protein
MVQTFHLPAMVMYGAEVWDNDEGGQRQDVSGRKESSPHSSPASRDCSPDVLSGTLGYQSALIDAAATVLAANRLPEHGGWPTAQGGAAILSPRVAVVSAGLEGRHAPVR